MKRWLFALLLLLAPAATTACSKTPHALGQLQAAAINFSPRNARLIAQNVEGRSCTELDYGAAVQDAIAKASPANALVNARFSTRAVVFPIAAYLSCALVVVGDAVVLD